MQLNILHSKHMLTGIIFFVILVNASVVVAQCSIAAWDSVTGTPQALGVTTFPVGKKYEQNCGLTVAAGSVPAYVTTTTPASETTITARFYLLPSPLNISSGDLTLFRARDGGIAQVEIRLRSSGSINHLVAFYRHNGVLVEHGITFPLQEVWQAVEVAWSAGNGNGAFSLRLNNVLQFSQSNLNNGNAVINEIDLGVVNPASASGTIAFDAFSLSRTGSPGLLSVSELRNISTRADVGMGDEIVIGGFIISGNTQKCVVVRGRGPSVNVPSGEIRLLDPILVLKSGTITIASNDNWLDSPEAATILDLGRNPTDNAESAIFVCIPPGAYTALLRGVNGATGVGIMEVFDADEGTPYLANISTRAPVGSGNLVAIGGFVIRGDIAKQILIRGRGPSVNVPTGVARLADPRVRLMDSSGTQIASNDNWAEAVNMAAVQATGRAPTMPLEAAILITLPPGAYTTIVDGTGGATGVGIVEMFDQSGGSVTAQ